MSTNITDLQQKQAPQTPKNFPAMLKAFLPEIKRALPKHLSGDRIARIALTEFRRNPKLAECDPMSVFAAVIQSSQLGLEIGMQGRAYLVPYKKECQFIPGWKGLVELTNRSGQGTVWTGGVFVGDDFDYMLGDSPFVHHKPAGGYDPSEMTHAYAIGRPKGAEWPIIEVWTMDRIVKHRNKYNKVGNSHYSFGNMEMYARKVVLLQVLKYMPMSAEMMTAVEMDHAGESSGQHLTVSDAIEGTWAHVPDEPVDDQLIVDSTGEIFDEKIHLSPERKNQDGSFSKRPIRHKQAAAQEQKQPAQEQKEPVYNTDDNPLTPFIQAMEAAKDRDELDELQEAWKMGNGPAVGFDARQHLELDVIYRDLADKLSGASESGDPDDGFGGME